MNKYICKDCGTNICRCAFVYGQKRCKSCAGKVRQPKGKASALYIDGRSSRKYYCTCGKLIDQRSKNCTSCAKVGNKNPAKKSWVRKKISLNHANVSGANNPAYHKGESFLPYTVDFTNRLKETIRKRDNYTCQVCGIKERHLTRKYHKKLDIHHIDYNKQNCYEYNLITLCKTCNVSANGNRSYWITYFVKLLTTRFGVKLLIRRQIGKSLKRRRY